MHRYRFATFNSALSREAPGRLARDLATPDDPQAQVIAEIIQRVRPDVLWLGEFDYDSTGRTLERFQRHYLRIGRHGAPPIRYPHTLALPSNTGLPSACDLNRDGAAGGPDDALGFGRFPGQYAFALLSRWPLALEHLRSFQRLAWREMPGARLPVLPDGTPWYDDAALAVLPLSSKTQIDLPVQLPGGTLHLLAAHPTPPAFDGPERRNACRNHDEIRLLADYLDPRGGGWLRDDGGGTGGLEPHRSFVILGDLNADPREGSSLTGAIDQLLAHPRVHREAAQGARMPASRTAGRYTADWRLRVDYVLPSRDLRVVDSGVFWPGTADPLHRLVQEGAGSDHRLVWVDVTL